MRQSSWLPTLTFAAALGWATAAHAGLPPVAPGDLLGSTGAVGASLISIDPTSGTGTFRAPLGAFGPVTEIKFRADGVLFGTTGGGNSNLITIDPNTGVESLVGQHTFGAVTGLAFVDDTLYGAFFNPGRSATGEWNQASRGGGPYALVTVDTTTAALTTIGTTLPYSPIRGLAYDSASGVMYGVGATPAANGTLGGDVLFTVDLATANTTEICHTGYEIGGITFGPDGLLYGGDVGVLLRGEGGGGDSNLLLINTTTGVATPIGLTGFPAISGLSFVPGGQPSSVEVPTLSPLGMALLVGALLLAGAFLLRSRSRTA